MNDKVKLLHLEIRTYHLDQINNTALLPQILSFVFQSMPVLKI